MNIQSRRCKRYVGKIQLLLFFLSDQNIFLKFRKTFNISYLLFCVNHMRIDAVTKNRPTIRFGSAVVVGVTSVVQCKWFQHVVADYQLLSCKEFLFTALQERRALVAIYIAGDHSCILQEEKRISIARLAVFSPGCITVWSAYYRCCPTEKIVFWPLCTLQLHLL